MVTPESLSLALPIDEANQVLSWLIARGEPEWQAVMTRTLNESEVELAMQNVKRKLNEINCDTAMCAIPLSTESVRKEMGWESDRLAAAVNLLKENGRLAQCGRGRGKCLVVLDITPLRIEGMDLLKMALECLKNEQRLYKEDIMKLKRNAEASNVVKDMQRKLKELEEQNSKLQTIVAQLERELADRMVSSWS